MNWIDAAVESIETDISDRRGLRQEWEQIDDEVKAEIRQSWARLIREAFDTYDPGTE